MSIITDKMVERVIAVLMERFGYGAYEGESVLTESEAEFIARKIVHVLEDLAEKEASQ